IRPSGRSARECARRPAGSRRCGWTRGDVGDHVWSFPPIEIGDRLDIQDQVFGARRTCHVPTLGRGCDTLPPMSGPRSGIAVLRPALALVLVTAQTGAAHADRPEGVCVEVSVDFTPADALQIVAWLEQPDGTYVDTLY